MLENLPTYIPLVFGLTTLLTLGLFHWVMLHSSYRSKAVWITGGLGAWLVLQMLISSSLFYTKNMDAMPPRFVLVVVPTFLTIFVLFLTKGGRAFMDSLPLKKLTYLNIVRIPVEICLYWLAVQKAIPELMTFAGRNFDILGGITVPLVAYFGFQHGKMQRPLLLIWNIIGLGLLLFIIANALLSAPTPLQQFGFEQPNIALLYFPFVWLPAFVAPIVLFGHLVSIRRLLLQSDSD